MVDFNAFFQPEPGSQTSDYEMASADTLSIGSDSTPASRRSPKRDAASHWWHFSCADKLLTPSQEKALARRVQKGDEEAWHHLVESNMRLVVRLALHYSRVRARHLSADDLVQEGCIGLMQAARKFDPERGFRFSTYALPWIQQSMLRAMVRHERLVRLPEKWEFEHKKAKKSAQELTQTLGRKPTSGELDANVESFAPASTKEHLFSALTLDSVSLDAPLVPGKEESWSDFLADENCNPAESAMHNTMRQLWQSKLGEALKHLPDVEAFVVLHRYGLGNRNQATLAEIGKRLNLTPERVRLTEKRALGKLRRLLSIEEMLGEVEKERDVLRCTA